MPTCHSWKMGLEFWKWRPCEVRSLVSNSIYAKKDRNDRCTGARTVGVGTCMGGAAFMFTKQEGGCSCKCFCIHLWKMVCSCTSSVGIHHSPQSAAIYVWRYQSSLSNYTKLGFCLLANSSKTYDILWKYWHTIFLAHAFSLSSAFSCIPVYSHDPNVLLCILMHSHGS